MEARSLVALALALGPAPAQQEPAPGIDLPPGPAASAWQRAAEALPPAPGATAPASLGEPWPAWGGAAWDEAAPWERWVTTVRAEAQAKGDDPGRARRRAALALLAHAQGRDDDAWRHFARTADDPATVAGLLARLFPGVESDHAAGADGLPTPLPADCALHPALPPEPDDPRAPQEATLEGLRVGDATVALRAFVDASGVQVDLTHRAGPAARVEVTLPVPAGWRLEAVFHDWERLEEPAATLSLEVSADEPERSAWGRFARTDSRWPARLPAVLPRSLAVAGLALDAGPDPAPRAARACTALGRLLGVPCRLVTDARATDVPGLEPTVLHLDAREDESGKLEAILSLAERFVLADDR